MSYQGTLNIIEKVSEGYDDKVCVWAEKMTEKIEKPSGEYQHTTAVRTRHSLLDIDEDEEVDTLTSIARLFDDEFEEVSECYDDGFDNTGDTSLDTSTPDCELVPVPSTDDVESHEDMTWFGYKFVGDNIDKNIKPSLQRHEIRGMSLHYFHGFAMRDRIDFSHLSNEPPLP